MSKQAELLEEFKLGQSKWPWCIAGGALRDAWFDKEIKDVDLFIFQNEEFFERYKKLGYFYMILGKSDGINYKTNPVISNPCYKWELQGKEYGETTEFSSYLCADLPGINVILVPKSASASHYADCINLTKKLIDSFPASLSKIAYNSQYDEWIMSSDWYDLAAAKEVVVDGTTNGKEYYNNKLRAKYPEFQLYYQVVSTGARVRSGRAFGIT